MISGLDLNQIYSYTLKGDTDNPTVFKLGVMPSYLMARVSSGDSDAMEKAYSFLQLSLKGWENLDVPFETAKQKFYGRELDVVPLSLLERLPINVISELSSKVVEINKLTGQEIKKGKSSNFPHE